MTILNYSKLVFGGARGSLSIRFVSHECMWVGRFRKFVAMTKMNFDF